MTINAEKITIRKDGRYMGRFQTGHHDGKIIYQYVYGRTYEEAEKKLKIAREVEMTYNIRNNITVQQAYSEWINSVVNRVKESTYANYKKKFEKHILPVFGDLLCTELTSAGINKFINDKISCGLSAGYIKDIIVIFKSMLKYVSDEYGLNISIKNITLPKVERKQIQKLDNSQEKAILRYIQQNITLGSLGVLFSLLMGLRIGEVCGLMWSDIDFKGCIHCVGGTQLYTNAKVNYLRSEGWNVIVLFPGSNSGSSEIAGLTEYIKYGLYILGVTPLCLSDFEFKKVENKISGFFGKEKYDKILIESHYDIAALWGEVLSERYEAKHICFLCNELFHTKDIENDFALSMKQRYNDTLAKLNECEREKEHVAACIKIAKRDVEKLKEQLAIAKETVLRVDELDACITLASESYDLNIANADEYAKLIVRYAEFPTNKDFLDAVKKNRKFSRKAEQAKKLRDTLENYKSKL